MGTLCSLCSSTLVRSDANTTSIAALRDATDANCALFSLNGMCTYAKIVNVYDGDTFKACFILDGTLRKFSCRVAGIDTPEMRPSRSLLGRAEHVRQAHISRQAFCDKVRFGSNDTSNPNDGIVWLELHEFDKYGRVLADVYNEKPEVDTDSKKSVNSWMIEEGFAQVYNGGKKQAFVFDS